MFDKNFGKCGPTLKILSLVDSYEKKLRRHRETARCFLSLNISLSHSKSLKIIRNNTLENGVSTH